MRSGIRTKDQAVRSGVNFYNSLIIRPNLVPIISSLLSARRIKTNKPSLDNEIFGVRKSMFGFNIGRVWPLVLRCFWTPLKTSAQKSRANFILIWHRTPLGTFHNVVPFTFTSTVFIRGIQEVLNLLIVIMVLERKQHFNAFLAQDEASYNCSWL